MKDLTAALKLDPDHVAALAGRGMIYLQLDAWDQALADFDAAIDRDRRNPSLQVQRGRALIGRGDYPRAVEALTQALRLDPHHDAAYAWRALARRRESATPSDEVDSGDAEPISTRRSRSSRTTSAIACIGPRSVWARATFAAPRRIAASFWPASRNPAKLTRCGASPGSGWAIRPGAIEDCDSAIEHEAASGDVYVARAFAHEELGKRRRRSATAKRRSKSIPQEVGGRQPAGGHPAENGRRWTKRRRTSRRPSRWSRTGPCRLPTAAMSAGPAATTRGRSARTAGRSSWIRNWSSPT